MSLGAAPLPVATCLELVSNRFDTVLWLLRHRLRVHLVQQAFDFSRSISECYISVKKSQLSQLSYMVMVTNAKFVQIHCFIKELLYMYVLAVTVIVQYLK